MLLPGLQQPVGGRAAALEDQVAVELAPAHRRLRLHPAHALEHQRGDVQVHGDALLLRQHRLLEVEVALVPLEHAEHDLAHLALDTRPQLRRRERTALDEHAPLAPPLREAADRGLVLRRRDLPGTQQHLAQAVGGQVAGREHDTPSLQVERLARAGGAQRQDPRGRLLLQLAQQLGQR